MGPLADVLARRLADVLETRGIPYAIGGSLSLATWGYARATVDVDRIIKWDALVRAASSLA